MDDNNNRAATPRIYVASLADYNAGRLHGSWIDATRDAEDVREKIGQMLGDSQEAVAEEWAIHDYENFAGVTLDEFERIDEVTEAAKLIVEHGPVFAALLTHLGGVSESAEAKRFFEHGYRGEFATLGEFVEELLSECYSESFSGLPEFIRYHIDFDGIARDIEMAGDVFSVDVERRVHVFDAHC